MYLLAICQFSLSNSNITCFTIEYKWCERQWRSTYCMKHVFFMAFILLVLYIFFWCSIKIFSSRENNKFTCKYITKTSLFSAGGFEGMRERDIGMITPPQSILQPVGLPHYTHGVTGHHVLTVQAFQKEQVSFCVCWGHALFECKLTHLLGVEF